MKKRILLLLSSLLFTALTVSAQSWLWGRQGNSGLKEDTWEKNIATNKTGNVYHVGDYFTFIQFGPYYFTGDPDALYLVKYDSNGNLLWATNSGGYLQNVGCVASDDSDDAYITGSGNETIFGNDTLNGAFLVKFAPNGNVLWAKQTPHDDYFSYSGSVATDIFGHEYVVANACDIIKYDRNGNIIWTVLPKVSALSLVSFSDVTTDHYGNLYMSGSFQDTLTIGTHQLTSATGAAFIAKLDSNGNILWVEQTTQVQNVANGYLPTYTIATDMSGAAYLTGPFQDSLTFGSTGNPFSINDTIENNFFVTKYNPGGSIAWAKAATHLNEFYEGSWYTFAICSDDFNHIYVSGGLAGSLVFANDSIKNDTSSVFLLKIDTSGHAVCSSTITGLFESYITSDSTGKFVYIGGGFDNEFKAGPDSLIDSTGGPDPFVARWQPCGACDLVVTDSSQSLSICTGQSVSLVAQGGTGYNWSPSTGLNATTGNNVVATPSVTTTYTITSSAGTCLDTAQVVVTVITPHVQVAPPSSTICTYQGAILVASGATNYEWYPSAGLNTTTGDSVIANPTVNTTYTVIGSNGNCIDSAQTYINLIPAPNIPTITVSVTGDSLISSAISNNQWYFDDVLIPDSTRQVLVIKGHAKGWYYVTVTNQANGCSTASDSTTSINQLSVINEQLSVYPNPTSGSVFVKINSAVGNISDWSLQFTDVLGRTLYTKSSLDYSNEIDLTNLANGMYFITVVNKTARVVFKVVKEN